MIIHDVHTICSFDTNNYEFTFSSRLPCSTFIGRVTANDLDGDSMTFKLASGDPSDHFRLDKNTGILTTSPRCGDDSTAYKTSYLLNISVCYHQCIDISSSAYLS